MLLVVVVATMGLPATATAVRAPAVHTDTALLAGGTGYQEVASDGGIFSFGEAQFQGSTGSMRLNQPIVGMASTVGGNGYWLVAADGGIFSFGKVQFHGSTGAMRLNQPIVGMASTADGGGYWLVARDGGIFSFGDAKFQGSTGSTHLNQPIVGMASTTDGNGYWLVASDGGIFSFGNAEFHGSTGAMHLNQPIVGMSQTADGDGYWLVARDGGVFSFGDAKFYGSTGAMHLNQPIMAMASTADGEGYWLVASDGGVFSFGDAQFYGSTGSMHLNQPIVGMSALSGFFSSNAQVEVPSGSEGNNCQPLVSPTIEPDSSLDSLVSSQAGPGWIGGDATYSTLLPSGYESFVFSDTLIGTSQSSGTAAVSGFIHNSELVGTSANLTGDFGGSTTDPQSLIPDTNDPSDMWQVSATYVENGSQLVFVNEFSPVAGSPFYRFTGVSGIAVLAMSSTGMPAFNFIDPVPTDSNTQWGTATTQSGGFTYIYGSDIDSTTNTFLGMKVARAIEGQSVDTAVWQYWNGTQWVSGEVNAQPIVTGTVLTGVTPQRSGNGYVAVSIPGSVFNDKTVDFSYACSPTGPWTTPTSSFSIPEVSNDAGEIAYIPTFHPDLSGQNNLVISYNVDNIDGLASLEQDVHQYQPRFLTMTSAP